MYFIINYNCEEKQPEENFIESTYQVHEGRRYHSYHHVPSYQGTRMEKDINNNVKGQSNGTQRGSLAVKCEIQSGMTVRAKDRTLCRINFQLCHKSETK